MRAKNLPLISEEVVKTTADVLGPHCAAAQALKDAERRRAAGEAVKFSRPTTVLLCVARRPADSSR